MEIHFKPVLIDLLIHVYVILIPLLNVFDAYCCFSTTQLPMISRIPAFRRNKKREVCFDSGILRFDEYENKGEGVLEMD